MKMLLLRAGRPGKKTPVTTVVPIVRIKTKKYGEVLEERWLSIKSDVMIVGANASGKTRWLTRLASHAEGIWRTRPTIFLRAVNPIGSWVGDPRVIEYTEKETGKVWSKMKSWEHVDCLIKWTEAKKAVVIIDDAHLLAGRKLDIALRLVRVAGIVVSGTSQENRIPINLRMALLAREPHIENLKTDAAYDVTGLFMWVVILAAMAGGAWQLSAVLGGLKLLGSGRRASKQN